MGYINNINSTCGNRLSYKKYMYISGNSVCGK